MRKELADKYIRGRGIEIGGLHAPLQIPLGAKVTYVDRLSPHEVHADVPIESKVQNVVIDDAERLENFTTESLDFIIANHVIEHCHDPIGTLKLWCDRLVRGGIIYCAVPEKTKTFDAPRPVTILDHLIADEMVGSKNTHDRHHYREWLSIIDKMEDPELAEVVNKCIQERANIHFHVWDIPAMQELLEYITDHMLLKQEEFSVNGSEVIWILRKI